jgi:peptidoglycan-associated lipoprotein
MAGSNGLNARGLGAMEGIKQGPVGVEHIIYFDLDSYSVKGEYQSVLEAHSRYLRADRNRRVNIEGHTDARGNAAANRRLSQERAEEVRQYLMLLGVHASRLKAVGKGSSEPANTKDPLAAENRRVRVVTVQ